MSRNPAPAGIVGTMLIGYARVSTLDQNPAHQIDALTRAGVDRDNIHVDTASGAKARRPELDLVMKLLRKGDTLKITRLDRLGRSVVHLVLLGDDLHVLEQGIDTATAEGRAMLGSSPSDPDPKIGTGEVRVTGGLFPRRHGVPRPPETGG